MFNKLLTTEFYTKRLGQVGETNKTAYTNFLEGTAGVLQPYGELEHLGSQKMAQMFKLFSEIVDIRASDIVVIGTDEYVVKTVQTYNFGSYPHIVSILVKQ